jgi:hypothetical protein
MSFEMRGIFYHTHARGVRQVKGEKEERRKGERIDERLRTKD